MNRSQLQLDCEIRTNSPPLSHLGSVPHLGLKYVVFFGLPAQHACGHHCAMLVDVESATLVPIHNSKGERRAIV